MLCIDYHDKVTFTRSPAWASGVVCSTLIGNCKSLSVWNGQPMVPRFFCALEYYLTIFLLGKYRLVMRKVYIKNRDELIVLHPDSVAYMLADGNYTKIVYISGVQVVLTMGITKVEQLFAESIDSDNTCEFVRLGRSLVINQNFLHHINVAKQKLTLFDGNKSTLTLQLPKQLLKTYKAELTEG